MQYSFDEYASLYLNYLFNDSGGIGYCAKFGHICYKVFSNLLKELSFLILQSQGDT